MAKNKQKCVACVEGMRAPRGDEVLPEAAKGRVRKSVCDELEGQYKLRKMQEYIDNARSMLRISF